MLITSKNSHNIKQKKKRHLFCLPDVTVLPVETLDHLAFDRFDPSPEIQIKKFYFQEYFFIDV